MPLIDYSKINVGPVGRAATNKLPPSKKGRVIDYASINIPASSVVRPAGTKARVAPKPVVIPKNAGKSAPITFQGRPLVTPVEQQRMKAATPKPTPPAVSRLTGKTVEQRTLEGKQMTAAFAGKSLFDGFKESADSYNNAQAKSILGQNAPAAGGITGNRWVDLAASLTTMGAVIQTGVQVVGGIVSAINFTKAMNSKWNWPTVEGGVTSNDLAVRVAQANPNMDKGTANSIASLVARTGGNAAQLNALVSNTSMLSRSLDKISLAAQNPSTALNIIPSAVQTIAQTGIFQSIPMPSGLVHSTAPAIPMGGKTLPAAPQIAVATEPYVSRDKFQVEHPLLERPQPAVPGVKTTKSMDTIMAEEEAAGRKLETTPRAVDKTIPAIDVKKANLVDVTAKVDLKSVQVKFPSADKVVLDTKRRTVMFMSGTTPLEAIAVDKPQLKDWYGIEGAKLLGEITRAVPIQPVSKVAVTEQKVLYHGTNKTIEGDLRSVNKSINSTTFGDVETERHGIFLTDSPEFAKEYGKNVLPYKVSGDANIVDIKLGIYLEDDPTIKNFIASLDPFGEDRAIWNLAKYQKSLWGFFEGELGTRFVSFLKEEGYDGARFEETSGVLDGGGKEVAAQTTVILNPKSLTPVSPVVAQVAPTAKQPWQMTKEEYDAQTLPNKATFAIVKDGKVLLSGTDNKIGYLAGLAEERGADLYIGDSATLPIESQPLIMGYTFDEILAAQQGGKLQHGLVASKMPQNAVQVPTYSQALRLAPSPITTPTAPALSKMETPAAPVANDAFFAKASKELEHQSQVAENWIDKYRGQLIESKGAPTTITQVSTGGIKTQTTGTEITLNGITGSRFVLVKANGQLDIVERKSGKTLVRDKNMNDLAERFVNHVLMVVPEGQDISGFIKSLSDGFETVNPDLSTTPQKGPSAAISNQKTGISTSTPITPRGGTDTGVGAVKWGKWIDSVGSRRTSGVGTGQVDTIKTPVTYRLGSGEVTFRSYANGDEGLWRTNTGKALQLKGDPHTYYIRTIEEDNPKYNQYVVIEARSGMGMGRPAGTVKNAIANAQEQALAHKADFDGIIGEAVTKNGDANPSSVPSALITSTSAPAAAPSLGNAAQSRSETSPAHGLIDYSRIELNGTSSQTSPSVLASVGNKGKGFDNYIQNTTGTKETSLSPFAKFKEGRDLQVRRYENEFDGLMKTPAGAEWMTLAIAADEVLREEYARPFSINKAGERVYAGGEFAPAILNRYLKQYGPNFGKFLQHLQRAGISTEPTLGLSAEKEALKQKHIYDARMSLANFQKNEPQLFTAYMAAADELGNANALLAEFYKGMISPETYANDKANPHYYVSLSAGRTDVFDRSGVAPLERTHGLTDLENVVPPLEGLKAVYVDAIRAQGINNAKREAVRANKNSEVATTELSDSIVHLKENGVDRAYDVHDTNVTKSVQNLTLKKPDVPTWEKYLVRAPTTLLRLFATGLNPAFGLFNIMRDNIQGVGTLPFTPTGLVKGVVRAFKSPGLSQWFDSYRDPMAPGGTKALDALKQVISILSYPNEVGESLTRSIYAESILDRGGTYLDQLHGYFASTGFFALHGTFFNDFIASNIPFTRATIAVMRSAYRNTFYGLPIGDKGGTFSGKQGAEKLAGRNLATIIFTIISALAVKEAGKEKEYKLLRDRASYFYFPTPSGAWVKLPVPIGFQPIKGIVDSLFGYKSDPLGVAGQTLNVLPGLESFMLPPALALFLQLKFNVNFFTGAAIDAAVGTPAANPLEAAIMKRTGWTEERTAFVVRAFLADIPSQVQYVFDMVGQGSSTQAFPASKRFIVKDPTTSSNAAVDDFYALVDATGRSSNPALKHYVNARADAIGKLLHNAKLYPADAKVYMTTATDNIIATFATIAENPNDYGIKKFGPFSWRPSGNYEELAP